MGILNIYYLDPPEKNLRSLIMIPMVRMAGIEYSNGAYFVASAVAFIISVIKLNMVGIKAVNKMTPIKPAIMIDIMESILSIGTGFV